MIRSAIAHYEIIEQLGEGGMGVVWKARDTHLDRLVAIKMLTAQTVDPGQLSRLVHEARAASALNHPGIVHIYDVGECDGLPYIAMEYVEGRTLEELIGRRGLRLPDALKHAAHIAHAVAAAHAAGIVHRDLKPANIMITPTGHAKVLDFGLARLIEPPAQPGSARTATGAGLGWSGRDTMVGTVPYLSPEQAEGRPLDARSDIFSFAIILYEMITGINPFRRESRAATVAAILYDEPKPLHDLVPSVPFELERLVARCLRKNSERRLQSMADLAIALRDLKEESDSGQLAAPAHTTAAHKRRPLLVWSAAALGIIAILCAAFAWWTTWRSRDRHPSPQSFEVVPITTYPGREMQPSLSPDGTQVAFAWNGPAQDKFHIYVKAIGPGPPLQLSRNAADDTSPAWSPDGASIAFLRDAGSGHFHVMLIPALGGPERKLSEIFVPDITWMPGPYLGWTSDSRSLVLPDHPQAEKPTALFFVSLQTGEKRQITHPPAGILGDTCASVSPDGQTLAFCRCSHLGGWSIDLYTVGLAPQREEVKQFTTEQFRPVGLTWNPRGGEVIFAGERENGTQSLWRMPLPHPKRGSPTDMQIGIAAWPTTSRRSTRLAFSRATGGGLSIWRLQTPVPGKAVAAPASLIASTRGDFAPRYSPDGKSIAFESTRGGNLEIWTCNGAGEECVQLTSLGSEYTGLPAWSPDGKQLAFYSRVHGRSQIFVIGADGNGLRQLTSSDANHFFPSWSTDGRWIYYSSSLGGTVQVWKMPAAGGPPVQVSHAGGFAARESPDGKSLYFTRTEGADTSLWKLPLDTGRPPPVAAADGGEETQVLPSVHLHNFEVVSDGLYFMSDASTLNFLSSSGRISTIASNLPKGYVGLSVSPDRKSILFTVDRPVTSELAMIENFE